MHLIKDDRSLVKFFFIQNNYFRKLQTLPLFTTAASIKIFKVYKNNLCMGTQKHIMKMLKERLISSHDMLGLFNLPMVNQL